MTIRGRACFMLKKFQELIAMRQEIENMKQRGVLNNLTQMLFLLRALSLRSYQ